MSEKIKAVIFDMDGLLIDSMIHWMDADRIFFKKYNIVLTNDIIKYFSGRSEVENYNWLKSEFNLADSVDKMLAERRIGVEKIYQEKTQVMPGVEDLIKKIKQTELKKAIASGAPLNDIKKVVDRFGWHNHFDELISSDHVGGIGKPDPGIYLHTAERLKINPADCVVLEDAENGVVAAKKAGMKCIAVLDKRWSFGDFSGADLAVESLEDERIKRFLLLK
jgi:HAD superfamily hydrolase (TIGR01509 family)